MGNGDIDGQNGNKSMQFNKREYVWIVEWWNIKVFIRHFDNETYFRYILAKQWLTENAKCNINEKDAETKD